MSIRSAIIENAAKPPAAQLTPTQLAAVHGWSVESVHQAASRMRAAGQLTPSVRQSTNAAGSTVLPLPPITGNGAVHTPAGEIMPKDERARRLSVIGRAAPANISVLAVRALEDMDRGSGLAVGPPPPMDREQRVATLARLMAAVGREQSMAALELAERSWQPVAEAAEPELP